LGGSLKAARLGEGASRNQGWLWGMVNPARRRRDGMNAGEAIPKLVPAKAGTALEAATLPSYQIKFDRLLS